jgi:hypothetical protein
MPHAAISTLRRPPASLALLIAIFALLALVSNSVAQERVHRLILKDGSYQAVNKYEVKGDRVRYFSSEREEWEELPSSLVDWPATNQYEKELAAGASTPEVVQLDKELENDREHAEAALPQVAPGLHLPDASGVFLLESFSGEPDLIEIQQTAGDVNQNAKGNIFRAAIVGAKANIELDGAHANVQSHVGVPSIYISPEAAATPEETLQSQIDADRSQSQASQSQTAQSSASQSEPQQPVSQPQQPVSQPQQPIVPFDRFRIVRTEVKNGKRIVGDVKRAPTGKLSQEQQFVKTTITNVTGGWLKLTPTEPLAPGEYALVEMMPKEGMNLYVWDFGVNPKAPANANATKPDAKPAPSTDVKKDEAPK